METTYAVINDWDRSPEFYGTLGECEDFIFNMRSFTTQGYSIVPCDDLFPDGYVDLFPECKVDLEF